jgi:hypothetical protein
MRQKIDLYKFLTVVLLRKLQRFFPSLTLIEKQSGFLWEYLNKSLVDNY